MSDKYIMEQRSFYFFFFFLGGGGGQVYALLALSIFDGWMSCDFTSFSTVFQSCQDDGQMILKGCV